MKDDIADLHKQSAVLPDEQNTDKKNKYEIKKGLSPIPNHATKFRRIFTTVGIAILCIAIAGGGLFAYIQLQSNSTVKNLSSHPLGITDVIPQSAVAIVVYDLSSDTNRSTVKSLWATTDSQISITGNPTALLPVQDIQYAYFFTLPNDSVPFLITKDTSSTKQFFSQQTGVKYVENGGWIIAHMATIDSYVSSIAQATLSTSSDESSLVTGNGFVARYIINPAAIPQIFSLPSNLVLNRKQIVFDVSRNSPDGVLQGEYKISEGAVPATVIPDTTQLASLIPSDPSFMRMGDNFFQDISLFQQSQSAFDSTTFNEPAVQQFLAKLSTPYALYSRTGADGIPDTGLIIQLPSDLIASLGHKNQVVEDLLTSFAPFVTGKKLETQIVFGDSQDGPVPIRYANLEGQAAALDYMIGDNYILISSSREGMHALSEMALGQGGTPMLQNDPWAILAHDAQLFVASNMVIGSIKDPSTLSLLPGNSGSNIASVIVSTKKDNTGINTHATILFTK